MRRYKIASTPQANQSTSVAEETLVSEVSTTIAENVQPKYTICARLPPSYYRRVSKRTIIQDI